jgi:hypothetical protein
MLLRIGEITPPCGVPSPPRVGQQHHHISVVPLGYSQASPEKSFPAFKRYYEPTKTTYNFSIPTFLPQA